LRRWWLERSVWCRLLESTMNTQTDGQTDRGICVGPGTHRTSRCGRPDRASEGTPRRRLPSRRKLRSEGTCWKVVPSSFHISLLPRCLTQQYLHYITYFYRKSTTIPTIYHSIIFAQTWALFRQRDK
jgi:hypothetical protein